MLVPVQAPRAVDIATTQLRQAILADRWDAGEHLPPERQLAVTLGINRQTLRAAVARLESEGLVRARQGSGVLVQEWRRTAGIALLPHLVEAGRDDLLAPFLAIRRAVAAEAVATACHTATDREIHSLDALAQRLASEPDLEALAVGNLEFSRTILRLARNLPAELLFNTVAAVYEASPGLRQVLLADAPAVRMSFSAIVALLRGRDPNHARAVVQQVLAALDQASLDRLESLESE